MRFLIDYSNRSIAKIRGWPMAGSPQEIGSIEEFVALIPENGRLILHPPGYRPAWVDYAGVWGDHAREHIDLESLKNNGNLSWVEIYCGLRE